MKNFIKILIFSLFAINTFAQQATEIDSKSVKLPRYANLATIESAIPIPQRQQGMMVYNIETASNWYYNGTAWKDMAVSSVSVPSPLSLTSSSTTITGETNQADEAGVMGINTTDGVSVGVLGRAANTEPLDGGAAVKGENMSTNGIGYGVMGTHNGTGWAGYFEGYNALKTQGNTYLNGDVGIGTDSPFGKLTINTQGVGWNFPSLLLIDDATDNTGGAILQFRNPADKRMDLQSHFGTQSDGTDSYMTFSHNAFYNMRLRGDGNLGIGSLNPNLAGLVVNKKVGNSHAIFGDNTSGVSIESNFPGIHFNSYFNGSRKTLSTGFTAGAEMNPTTGDFTIYTSPASTTAGSTASVFERLKITKEGVVNVGPFFNVNNPNALNIGVSNNISFGGSNYTTGFISTIGTSNSAARMAFYTGYSFTGGASSMQERMTISNTGNVGIANTNPTQKLEVNGKIKIADDANAAIAGNVRWNSVTNDFEGYNGNEWLSLTKSKNEGWGGNDLINENQIFANGSETNFGFKICMRGTSAIVSSSDNQTYIYRYNSTNKLWVIEATLSHSGSVSINGNFAVIGAWGSSRTPLIGEGVVYVYYHNGLSWIEISVIDGMSNNEYLGYSVDVNSGGHLVVGTTLAMTYFYFIWTTPGNLHTELINSVNLVGKVRVSDDYRAVIFNQDTRIVNIYEYEPNTSLIYSYVFKNNLIPSDGLVGDKFGFDADLNGDYVVVGAPNATVDFKFNQGKSYVFHKKITGYTISGIPISQWVQEKILTAGNSESNDWFGASVGIFGDYIVIGSPNQAFITSFNTTKKGKAHVFNRNGTEWIQKATLKPKNSMAGDYFGYGVDISNENILIGAPGLLVGNSAEIYFFSR